MSTRPSGEPAHKVCLVTAGGDAPGVNAVVRAFVHGAMRRSIGVFGCHYGFEGLLREDGIVPLGLEAVRGILPRAGSALGCSTRVNPFFVPDAGGGDCHDEGPTIVRRLRALGVDTMVLVGGDGSTLAARRFDALGMTCVCIPKTIDNDLGGTDVSVGFDTAVETAARAVDALHATAEAHARVMILEVMGRNAGFIALHGGLAGGADVILIPEIPYRLARVLAKVREREALGLRFSIVVIAEGARPLQGDVLEIQPGKPGSLPRLGGAGARLAHDLEQSGVEHEVRLTVLGHLQRGGSPTSFDRNLGTEFGAFAVELCHAGARTCMVALRDGHLTSVALPPEDALHKRVRLDGPMIDAARAVGVELGADAGEAPHR